MVFPRSVLRAAPLGQPSEKPFFTSLGWIEYPTLLLSTTYLISFRYKLLIITQCIVTAKYVLAHATQLTLQMENFILQCKVNGEEQIESKLPTLHDEFKYLNEAESVSNTLEKLLDFTTHTSESAANCSRDAGNEIYSFKCNQCEY